MRVVEIHRPDWVHMPKPQGSDPIYSFSQLHLINRKASCLWPLCLHFTLNVFWLYMHMSKSTFPCVCLHVVFMCRCSVQWVLFFHNKHNPVAGMNHTLHRWATWFIRPLSFCPETAESRSHLETVWIAKKKNIYQTKLRVKGHCKKTHSFTTNFSFQFQFSL